MIEADVKLAGKLTRLAEENERLRAVNAELLEALRGITEQACTSGCPEFTSRDGQRITQKHTTACKKARSALAHAEEVHHD